MNLSDSLFKIGTEGIDTAAIVEEIKATVARKTEDGFYADSRVTRAERTNLQNFTNDAAFLEFYFDRLRDAIFVDINDFEIYERRRIFPKLLVFLKRVVWKLLRFYTYRMWSQQNEINGLLLSATEAIDSKYHEKIRELEARIAKLEQ